MDESEENLSAENIQTVDSPVSVKIKLKKRSLVERELETNLTARVTSPVTNEGSSTSRYGRARRLKTGADIDMEKFMKPLKIDVSKTQSPAYKMHASNSPIQKESPKKLVSVGSTIEDQIENIYNENISLSRFGSEEKAKSQSPAKKFSKVYIRKDLIQKPDTDTVVLIKNMFSPTKPNTHLNNILERSSEKYNLNGHGQAWNGFPDNSSVVKTLDFDGKKKKEMKEKVTTKNELFNLEASCEYQVGDLAWARVGTYPFWPCIVTREPFTDTFVKKKLFGRVERAVIHVTFFGDNGRRGWIVDNMLRKYHGRAEFESAREKFTPEGKKKDPRLYAAHFVSEKKLPLWNVSVEEAETLMKEPKRLRIDALYDMLEKTRATKTTPKREKGGKITRTDSDVSLSESLYDTLFSEDDGKNDDNNRSKKARKKSLDVSEVVTACLDNMAAKSGIIQIQRQSHMDRWLQKAKSKTPEKIQPKLQIKFEKERRKEKVKKKAKEGKKTRKLRNNESLGSDTNLNPYQNEHDYSSVNYENHNINDSLNKNTDSASGHDSTFDSIGLDVSVKIENLSSSVDDSQDDIITTVVNDDIVVTESENINKNISDREEQNQTDNVINSIENNNEQNLKISKTNENGQIETQVQSLVNNSDTTNSVQLRRSKRKRQTSEGLNNSIENKAKEPKLDLPEQKTKVDETTANSKPKGEEIQNNSLQTDKESESIEKEIDCTGPNISKSEMATSPKRIYNSEDILSFNSNYKPVVVIEPLKMDGIKTQLLVTQSKELVHRQLLNHVIEDDNITEESVKVPDASSGTVQNEIVNNTSKDDIILQESSSIQSFENVDTNPDTSIDTLDTSSNNVNEESKQSQDNISNEVKLIAESSTDIEKMEVDNGAISNAVEKEKPNKITSLSIISEAIPDSTVPLQTDVINKTAKVVIVPLVQENLKTVIPNNVTNVVIGEETYIFDRTLSQDYDEVDADRCDKTCNLPETSSNDEAEDINEVQMKSNSHEDTLPEENCQVDSTKDDSESSVTTLSTNDDATASDGCASSNKSNIDITVPECSKEPTIQGECNSSDLENSCKKPDDVTNHDTNSVVSRDCIFLDQGNNDNNTDIITHEDNIVSSVTNDVSSVMNEEQIKVSNQITEENNTKCVFLDNSLESTDAPQNDSKQKKLKSPRLSLNKNRASKFNNKDNEIKKIEFEPPVDSLIKVTTTSDRIDLETASINSDDSELMSITKRKGRSKEKQEVIKALNDPEFMKYFEIRQDALLDEQPDLTQDEIVTYLYQNWLYEEDNKSDAKKTDDTEQFNLVKGLNEEVVSQPKKIRKKPKEKEPELKNVDIRSMMQKEKLKTVPDLCKPQDGSLKSVVHESSSDEDDIHDNSEVLVESMDDAQSTDVSKSNEVDDSMSLEVQKACSHTTDSLKKDCVPEDSAIVKSSDEIHTDPKHNVNCKDINTLSADADSKVSENLRSSTDEAYNHKERDTIDQEMDVSENVVNCAHKPVDDTDSLDISNDVEDSNAKSRLDEVKDDTNPVDLNKTSDLKGTKDRISKMNGIDENVLDSKTNKELDPETASIKSEDSGVSITRRRGRPKGNQDVKKAIEDPDFVKYLEARQDALMDEQPDLTQDEIVTYLYQTWFYEEANKSELKKTDDTEQSNLVKGLHQEPAPQPKKIRKKHKVEKEPDLKNVDIRDMIQKEKPKRKITQSKPYYNEDDSDLEEEDLETFKIFDRGEENEDGEEIDEVELYFEKLTKPKPNVFKGFVRERVCEICEIAGNLVKCKNCHGTFHVNCVKKGVEVTEVVAPTRGRKKKKGRRPKGYDYTLDGTGSQSDERSQDANNSEELNMSIEDETGSHIIIDADNFESQWELKMKELQTGNEEEYASDQEMNWAVEPGHCEIVDIKQKEKPVDYSDYKCDNCLKYETPVCFVCKSNKSPKTLTEVRQKCQVAHCHRYYHLECLDHWPQTQFNSWEPSKTNKKVIEYIEALSCPRHVCHTCVSDDPRGCKTRFCGDKLARCVRCPATYHSYTKCLPAGTQILTGSQIICPRHYEHRPGKVPCHVNTGWCFICALGGTLICCEYCPTSFHAECLNIKPPEGSYMCEDCETGRLPLYGEMVWVKLGHYRWWPGIVLHPTEIPDNIMAVKHSPGEFVVRFFGQYDHYWVNRGRVFPFQEEIQDNVMAVKHSPGEFVVRIFGQYDHYCVNWGRVFPFQKGDSGKISSQKSKIDAAFTTAMEHAQRACEILKKMQPNEEEDMDIASSLLPPHYVKLKVNKPVGLVTRREVDANSLTQCDCDPSQPDPCGPYSHCLNRMLLTECGPLCRAGERCNNRAFERRLYPRLAAYRTPQRGWGLRTLEDIRQGQFVIEYVGELIDMEEFRRRMCRKHEIRDENFYFLTLDKERMIDAGPKGNLARFMNHCCEPNCETQKWTVLGDIRVGLFALRDIPANSEVTFNYNLECAGIEKKRCLCGAKRCSGYIGAKPKQLQDDQPKKAKPPAKRTYKKRKPVEDATTSKAKIPKIKIKPIKPRELTEIEKDLLIIKNATSGMSSDSEGSRLSSVDEKNPKALKRKRVSFSTDDGSGKKVKLAEDLEVTE